MAEKKYFTDLWGKKTIIPDSPESKPRRILQPNTITWRILNRLRTSPRPLTIDEIKMMFPDPRNTPTIENKLRKLRQDEYVIDEKRADRRQVWKYVHDHERDRVFVKRRKAKLK